MGRSAESEARMPLLDVFFATMWLFDRGVITEDDFQQGKARVLRKAA